MNRTKSLKSILMATLAAASVISCAGSKATSTASTKDTKVTIANSNARNLYSKFNGSVNKTVRQLLKDAEKYLGTPYKLGGNDSNGFDCSGYAVKVFSTIDLKLPRRSADQATVGTLLPPEKVQPGDLLFFATSGGSRVSHVGIVHTIEKDGDIRFIHASTSKGVIISSLSEKYWNKAYLHARRVL